MLIRLFAYGLFDLADDALNLSRVLFSSPIGFQVGVIGKFADFLFDCSFDFVDLAGCLIVRAHFHHDSFLCRVVGFNQLGSFESSLHLDCFHVDKLRSKKCLCLSCKLLFTNIER